MLKRKISKADFDALPDALKTFYKSEGEDYLLQVEGMVPRERLEEFRDANVTLKKDLEKFKDLDPAKYTELLAIETNLRAGKLKDGKTVEEIVQERIDTMKRDHEKKVRELEEGSAKKDQELNRLKITDAAVTLAQKKGLKPSAAEDLKARAERIFRLDEKGQPVAMDGDKVRFGKDGSPLSINEWLDGQVTEAPHLFQASNGTGAGEGNGTGATGHTRNPWKKETLNLTEQGEILKMDPAMAKRMKAEAGIR